MIKSENGRLLNYVTLNVRGRDIVGFVDEAQRAVAHKVKLPEGMMKEAEHAAGGAEVFLVIGTSANVHPAAGLIPFAKQGGAKVIEINTDDTPYTAMVDCALRGPAGELLPKLL